MSVLRKVFLLVLIAAGSFQIASGQITSSVGDPSRSFPPVNITFSGLYQERTYNDTGVSQISSGVASRLQLTPSLGASINVQQATVEHDSLQRVHGIADVQAALNYVIGFSRSHIALGISANIPTGKEYLSKWAYDASFPAGISQYDFSVPFYGRGTSIAPSVSWVYALSSDAAIGFGLTYRIKGSYEPHRQLPGKYEWGNEFSVTAGGQWQVSSGLTLLGDLTLSRYAGDKINEIIVYAPGNRIVFNVMAHKTMGVNDLWLSALYRNVGTNRILFNSDLIDESITATPGSIRLSARYRIRMSQLLRTTIAASAQLYNDTFDVRNISPTKLIRYEEVFSIDQFNVFKIGARAEFSLSPALTLPVQLDYLFGDLTGLNAGLGFSAIL